MPRQQQNIQSTAQSVLAVQDEQVEAIRARQMLAVSAQTASGSGDMNAVSSLDRRFRLVSIRCHFSGTVGLVPLTLHLDAVAGAAFDAGLFIISRAGVGRDVNFRISAEESTEPSPWTFQAGDQLRIAWTNPDSGNITWGLIVSLANVS